MKRAKHALYARFPNHKLFNLSALLEKSCSSPEDRKFLMRRLNSYLNGRRRGNLKLPKRFSELLTCLSNRTKGSIRGMMHAVKPDTSVEHPLPKWAFDYVRRILPSTLWSTTEYSFDSCARRVDVNRLSKRDVPRGAGSLWPSSPTFMEMLEKLRRGKTSSGLWKPTFGFKNHMSVSELRKNPKLATRIVTDNIIGIRPQVSIPEKFLRWFRYRDGMLFLTVRYSVPIGLVRFLLGQWIRNPFSLWLRVNCRFKYYLKLHRPPSKDGDPIEPAGAFEARDRSEPSVGNTLLTPFVATTEEDQAFADEIEALFRSRR